MLACIPYMDPTAYAVYCMSRGAQGQGIQLTNRSAMHMMHMAPCCRYCLTGTLSG